MTVRRLLPACRAWRHAQRGSITVLAAVMLYAIVLLGVAAWAGIQEWADHTLVTRLLADAAYDASHRTADGADVSGAPALTCLDPSCTPAPCPTAIADDPDGTTAAGQACRALSRGLRETYPARTRASMWPRRSRRRASGCLTRAHMTRKRRPASIISPRSASRRMPRSG